LRGFVPSGADTWLPQCPHAEPRHGQPLWGVADRNEKSGPDPLRCLGLRGSSSESTERRVTARAQDQQRAHRGSPLLLHTSARCLQHSWLWSTGVWCSQAMAAGVPSKAVCGSRCAEGGILPGVCRHHDWNADEPVPRRIPCQPP
jgi:hypothetical protein